MTATRLLPIWCADGELARMDLHRVREAKEALWLDYRVQPCQAEGSIVERVLAWGTQPPFVCAYALVDPLGTDAELSEAVAWVLGEPNRCVASIEVEQVLQALLGPGVREIPPAELEAEQRLADYERGA